MHRHVYRHFGQPVISDYHATPEQRFTIVNVRRALNGGKKNVRNPFRNRVYSIGLRFPGVGSILAVYKFRTRADDETARQNAENSGRCVAGRMKESERKRGRGIL